MRPSYTPRLTPYKSILRGAEVERTMHLEDKRLANSKPCLCRTEPYIGLCMRSIRFVSPPLPLPLCLHFGLLLFSPLAHYNSSHLATAQLSSSICPIDMRRCSAPSERRRPVSLYLSSVIIITTKTNNTSSR